MSISIVMLFQVSALFVRSFIERNMVESGIDAMDAKNLSALVGFAVLAVLMWPVIRTAWPTLRQLFRRPDSWVHMIAASAAIGVLYWIINKLGLVALDAAYLPHEDSIPGQRAIPIFIYDCGPASSLLLSILVLVLVTPLIEEVINRGLFLHTLLSKGKWLSILLSALLFMVLHKFDTYPIAFLFGVVAAIQILNHRSLWAVVITHGSFNFMVQLDRQCLHGMWQPGQVSWELGGEAQLAVLALIISVAGVVRLLSPNGAGATRSSEQPRTVQRY